MSRQIDRRRRWTVHGVVLIIVALLVGAWSSASGAQVAPAPSITVTPHVDLVQGQQVQVEGAGWPASTDIGLAMCAEREIAGPCDATLSTLVFTRTDAQGAFATTFHVQRFFDHWGVGIDCAQTACGIAAGTYFDMSVTTPVTFLAVDFTPQLSVAPVDANGATTVTGSGFPVNAYQRLAQCPPGASAFDACEDIESTVIYSRPDGSFSAEVTVGLDVLTAEAGTPALHDCTEVACSLLVGTDEPPVAAQAPLDLTAVPVSARTMSGAPTTALVDRATVELTGSGFVPGSTAEVQQCAGRQSKVLCPARTIAALPVGATGAVSGSSLVRRDADVVVDHTTTHFIDCAVDACGLVVTAPHPGSTARHRALVGLSFLPSPRPPIDPTVAVTPGGQPEEYTVSGTGFPLGGAFEGRLCGREVHGPGGGCHDLADPIVPSSAGDFHLDLTIARFPSVLPGIDCLDGCWIQVWTSAYGSVGMEASSELVPIPPPVTVTIENLGTLDPGSDDVVVRVRIECERYMEISVVGWVAQPGVEGGYHVPREGCGPDMFAFIPTREFTRRDVPLSLGAAEVSITVVPSWPRAAAPITVTGTTTLVDEAALVAAVQAGVADPANVELREQLRIALETRVRQDPVFAAELAAAIRGGWPEPPDIGPAQPTGAVGRPPGATSEPSLAPIRSGR